MLGRGVWATVGCQKDVAALIHAPRTRAKLAERFIGTRHQQGLFSELKASSDKVDAGDYADVGSIDFYDGACPGNDTYVAATAPDYATLAALQSALVALDWNCRVVIVEPNPSDAAKV